jgi:cytochrome c
VVPMSRLLFLFLPASAVVIVAVSAAPVKNDNALGQRMMLRCQTCHAVKAGAPAKVGPNLNQMFGRKAGTLTGYTFSLALRKSGIVWNDATLDKFLEKPSASVPGTLMAFSGMPKKEERAALIAWLKRNTK